MTAVTPAARARFRDDVLRGDVTGVALDLYLVAVRTALPLGLRTLSLPMLLQALDAFTPPADAERAQVAVARSEAFCARLGVPCTCLFRALTRWAALRAGGIDATFAMGVTRADGEVGHAWVEANGVPVGELPDPNLIVTFLYPPKTDAATP